MKADSLMGNKSAVLNVSSSAAVLKNMADDNYHTSG